MVYVIGLGFDPLGPPYLVVWPIIHAAVSARRFAWPQASGCTCLLVFRLIGPHLHVQSMHTEATELYCVIIAHTSALELQCLHILCWLQPLCYGNCILCPWCTHSIKIIVPVTETSTSPYKWSVTTQQINVTAHTLFLCTESHTMLCMHVVCAHTHIHTHNI